MKLQSLLLVGFSLLAAKPVMAQNSPTYPYKTVEYQAEDNRRLSGPEGAYRRIESTYRDSLYGTVRVYNAAGKLLKITPYAHMAAQVKLGPETTFYEDGQLRSRQDYVANQRQGEFVVYYPDGKVKRREQYQNDVRQSGECYDPEGKVLPFFEYYVLPSYHGKGYDAMVSEINRTVRYPIEALKNEMQGKVFVSFRVSTTGKVENVQILKGVGAILDDEVVRAVKKLSGFTPGVEDGSAIPVSFTVPITFKAQ